MKHRVLKVFPKTFNFTFVIGQEKDQEGKEIKLKLRLKSGTNTYTRMKKVEKAQWDLLIIREN